MKTMTKVLLGVAAIAGLVAITSGGEKLVSEGDYTNADGEMAKWKITEPEEGVFAAHVKFPGHGWVEIGQGSINALRELIDSRMGENGYLAPEGVGGVVPQEAAISG